MFQLIQFSFIMFIAVIASTVQLVEMIVEKISPAIWRPRYFLTSYCGKLCHFRWCIIYAGKQFAILDKHRMV